MGTSIFDILVYRLVYSALRQKISCVARAPLLNSHSRDYHTRFARAANFQNILSYVDNTESEYLPTENIPFKTCNI